MSDRETEREYEAGELQKVKAAEDATRKNIDAVIAHANETRALLRQAEDKIKTLERTVLTFENLLGQFQSQIGAIHAKILGGGPTT